MKSVMRHNFGRVPEARIPRSKFNRSHGLKTTFDAGYLVPIFVDEALPGDTFSLRMTSFARMATPIVPLMDNLFLDTFFFAVPIRLIWDNWEKFNGAQDDPGDSVDYMTPILEANSAAEGSLSDYFGIPIGVTLSPVSLWHRAYNLIWNEWFRDQNLQDSVPVSKDDGPDSISDFKLLRRGKRHDYFTSCLPWPQKGDAVEMPLGLEAPVRGLYITDTQDTGTLEGNSFFISDDAIELAAGETVIEGGGLDVAMTGTAVGILTNVDGASDGAFRYPYTDLSQATAATINQIRQAFQLQKLYERDARAGTRYTEIVRSHFGVISPDARLQRPEYLGGGSTPVNIHPVAQTSSTDETTPQGNLAAFGTSSAHGHGFTKSFTEHCVLIGLASVRADLTYQQGLNRMFSRRTREEFYWPALAHIGEQAVLNKEIYAQGSEDDDAVFGYQERYAEYRYKPSVITGQFRSTAAAPLDVWHLSQEFEELPVLNGSFIEDNPPLDRVVATPSEPHFLFDAYFRLISARPMPVYSVPGLIDHF